MRKSKEDSEAAEKEKEGRIAERILEYQSKLKNLNAEKDKESKKLQDYTEQLDNTTNEVEKEDFQNTHERNRIENDEKIEEIILNDRRNEIASLQAEIVRFDLFRQRSRMKCKATKSTRGQEKTKPTSRIKWPLSVITLQQLNLICCKSTNRSSWLKVRRKSRSLPVRSTWRSMNP